MYEYGRDLLMNNIFYQDDSERHYYVMDFSQNKLLPTGVNLTGVPVVTSEIRGGFTSTLSITDVAISGSFVGMWISGGEIHKTYKIEVQTSGINGVVLEGDGFLRIGD